MAGRASSTGCTASTENERAVPTREHGNADACYAFELRHTNPFSLAASVALAVQAAFVEKPHGPAGVAHGCAPDLAFPVKESWLTIGVCALERAGAVRATIHDNAGRMTANEV